MSSAQALEASVQKKRPDNDYESDGLVLRTGCPIYHLEREL